MCKKEKDLFFFSLRIIFRFDIKKLTAGCKTPSHPQGENARLRKEIIYNLFYDHCIRVLVAMVTVTVIKFNIHVCVACCVHASHIAACQFGHIEGGLLIIFSWSLFIAHVEPMFSWGIAPGYSTNACMLCVLFHHSARRQRLSSTDCSHSPHPPIVKYSGDDSDFSVTFSLFLSLSIYRYAVDVIKIHEKWRENLLATAKLERQWALRPHTESEEWEKHY